MNELSSYKNKSQQVHSFKCQFFSTSLPNAEIITDFELNLDCLLLMAKEIFKLTKMLQACCP